MEPLPLPVNPIGVPGFAGGMNMGDVQQVRDENIDVDAGQRISIDQAGELVAARFEEDRTQFFVSVYNLPSVLAVRSLRTDKIGQLCSITGTVTRTSDVRPELLTGCFRCGKCGNVERDVEQQFQYTQPLMCTNPRCDNRSEWQLETADSTFVDWQRLRVQENSDEIPAGSMPRSIDVIVRGEVVEKAKAGDKCIFTGIMAVVPDAGGLSRAGEAAQTSRGALNNSEGVRGLKALGVRELTYKTCFVATSVLPAEVRSGLGNTR
ncbi:hypothetical protein TrRE_jg11685, partial [Triparma retinervis]